MWELEVHTSNLHVMDTMHWTSPCTCVRTIGRCDVITNLLSGVQQLSSLSQGFQQHAHPFSLAHALIGLHCGKGCWKSTVTCKILCASRSLFGAGQQRGRTRHECSWWASAHQERLSFFVFLCCQCNYVNVFFSFLIYVSLLVCVLFILFLILSCFHL